ncbi:hypothetical protein LTR99_007084 [Exophiala xenobiotica]|uniref:Interferon-induced GTP-binding protein Mx n=1 Tax=Vermiconidia calcicola TaxID=1690605 RepID=A0AAV9PVT7_9PEZI|nr:hypothetical protein LTR92_006903 [Exophiala xenobiotica]KAK5528876.1 hypothetical protein LTR25_010061 [Vermiconidia calcicola]KAK5544956.1 hypothetical protein LTR23_004085 [Chaetothyriales sp. CCFEE 6169]KAK5221094.1 hypothetical protein LTR72_006652 [Exophiala xenobiotica]KAK5269648.1 hypothetical protein LTR96_005346 [Exophiala xenobiotica]
MADANEFRLPQVGLQTPEHEELLNIIDTLRSQGISRYVDLPQLIVCGDQSSGKSSVLEAISGLRFPTKDNLCTRFATELILRRSPSPNVTVTIIPGQDRSEASAKTLSAFKSPSTSIDEFAKIVNAAEKAMGLDIVTKVFSKDILRVELSGPNQPHLTLVDLPGIFWAGDQSQSDDDAALVRSLVESYMKKARSIILAVVSAKSDLAMQVITKLAREIDPHGDRTLGVITKPDLLFAGSDSENTFVKLAKNENIVFKLGWHVLKNRDYDTRETTREQRDAAEKKFFQGRVWSSALSQTHLGVENLRPRLSRVLLAQILVELPGLVRDVDNELQSCKDRLNALGGPRRTSSEQRLYLLRTSHTFVNLLKPAVDGTYVDAFFGSPDTAEGYSKRLRAVVQFTMKEFAEKMSLEGHALQIVDSKPAGQTNKDGPPVMLRDNYLEQVTLQMRRNHGRELPGLFNPSMVGDLFFDQAKPWPSIVKETAEKLVAAARATINLVLDRSADTVTKDGIMRYIIRPNMEPICDRMNAKVEEILKPHIRGHPLTFNHYFTENLQKKRQEEVRKSMALKMRQFLTVPFGGVDPSTSNGGYITQGVSADRLLKALVPDESEPDMEKFASIEATHAMEAYYKVALKSIIDSFGMYAVEACLLEELPEIFRPEIVFELDDETITKIAGESAESIMEREDLQKKLKILEDTMLTLRRLKTFTGSAETSGSA